MEPIDLSNLFLTCKTIVNTEVKDHCDTILEKLNTLIPLSEKKGQTKRLKKMRKKVRKLRKFSFKYF